MSRALIIFLTIVIFYNYRTIRESYEKYFMKRPHCNNTLKRCYQVSTKYNEGMQNEASQALADINEKILRFLRFLRKKYLWEPDEVDKNNIYMRDATIRLLHHFNSDALQENTPLGLINTSYVEDKGRIFSVCLREKKTGNLGLEKRDGVFFVILHELAHIANAGWGHEYDFWQQFKHLVKDASEAGIYDIIDYNKTPIEYCGLKITYNPFHDDSVYYSS